ncbi:hypothetical protein ACFVU0_34545 [Streptomyces sp. NPDC058122]|uniref:hypothetical protein n=1 Tax=Streptomyces sp. NPDC058122 TaxID=3346349 RepID=UPI0036E5C323
MDHVTIALFGLNKDYTIALVGFAGTILGAVVAYLSMRYQVNRQEREQQLDHATKECGKALLTLLRLFRKPEAAGGGATEVWQSDMVDQMDVLKLTIPLFQREDLRDRLNATVDILANWHYVIFDGPHRDEYPESGPVIRAVLQHAVDCLGATRRGARRLPQPSEAFTTARHNIGEYFAWDAEASA